MFLLYSYALSRGLLRHIPTALHSFALPDTCGGTESVKQSCTARIKLMINTNFWGCFLPRGAGRAKTRQEAFEFAAKSKMARRFVTLGPPPRRVTVRGGPRGGGGRPTGVRGAASATGTAGAGPGRAATAPPKRVWPRLNLRLSQKWRAGA